MKVQVALGNIASKRERIKILYKKIEDLIKYLDPRYIDRMAVPDAMILQFILAEEQFILSQVALLEQVNNLQPSLDSAHIKGSHRVYYKQQVQDNGTPDVLTSARRHQVPLLIQSKCRRHTNLAEQRGIAGAYHSFLLQTFQLLFHRDCPVWPMYMAEGHCWHMMAHITLVDVQICFKFQEGETLSHKD
ncbi:uncharacterized protein LOC116815460 [Chelonoidis abingdonii]|uniref:uncharacterized protein LOC116815460 n=1 Tax=Chelonoidis abingdonii TaxID=106734 RepID=UPI003F4952AA